MKISHEGATLHVTGKPPKRLMYLYRLNTFAMLLLMPVVFVAGILGALRGLLLIVPRFVGDTLQMLAGEILIAAFGEKQLKEKLGVAPKGEEPS